MKTYQNARKVNLNDAKEYLIGFMKDSELNLSELKNRAYSIMSMSKFPQKELDTNLSEEEIHFLKLRLKSNQIDQVINEIELTLLDARRSNDQDFARNRRTYIANKVRPFIQDCFNDYDPTLVKNKTEQIAIEIMKMYHDLDEFDSEDELSDYKYYQIGTEDFVDVLVDLLTIK